MRQPSVGEPFQIELLLAAGAAAGIGDVDGNLPLHEVGFQIEPENLERLLVSTPDIEARNSMGQTPLESSYFSAFKPSYFAELRRRTALREAREIDEVLSDLPVAKSRSSAL